MKTNDQKRLLTINDIDGVINLQPAGQKQLTVPLHVAPLTYQ